MLKYDGNGQYAVSEYTTSTREFIEHSEVRAVPVPALITNPHTYFTRGILNH